MQRRTWIIGGGLATLAAGATWSIKRQMGSTRDYRDAAQSMRAELSTRPDAIDFVRYATLAPNGHNTQPWHFDAAPNLLSIRPDFSRRTPIVDPDDHHIFVSLGCAAENLVLAGAARGLGGDVVFDGSGDGRLTFAYGRVTAKPSALFDAIPHRQSTRAEYGGRAASAADLKTLAEAATMPRVHMALITDRSGMDGVRDLVMAGNSSQLANPDFMRELKSWLRFSPRHARAMGDGLYGAASGSPALPEWLGPMAFDLILREKSDNEKYAREIRSSAGVAVFVGERSDREHWTLVGRACQRFLLQATALGMKVAFINQPVEVPALRSALAMLVGQPGARPDLVVRFGYGPTLPYSMRRPASSVLTVAETHA